MLRKTLRFKLKAITTAASQSNYSHIYVKEKIREIFLSFQHTGIMITPENITGKFHRARPLAMKGGYSTLR